MKKITGKDDITEVWDYRLSTASPLIDRSSGTWVVKLVDNAGGGIVAEYDTGVMFEDGDERDSEKLKTCYEWLYAIRDNYARKDLEEIRPRLKRLRGVLNELASALASKSTTLGHLAEIKVRAKAISELFK